MWKIHVMLVGLYYTITIVSITIIVLILECVPKY